ncbi:MAG TPA: L,D-transpeptidase [Patescibacteria group bacterium]|nr:L,D-transpeptidase [Patescibacteria group bacterium]
MKLLLKISKINKLFLFGLPIAAVIAGGVLFFSARQFILERSCGCGLPSAEANGEYEEIDEVAIFNGQPVETKMAKLIPNPEALKQQEGVVLGATDDYRWIEIDLSDQKLYAHEGDKIVYEFLVSTGKWAPTPTGEFRVWIKLRYTKMSGGVRGTGTYYYLPNVPYTQYFYKGFGLHGTYWHNNFGHPMSHGCVNMATPDAEKLFYWTSPSVPQGVNVVYPSKGNPGTKVVIHQ